MYIYVYLFFLFFLPLTKKTENSIIPPASRKDEYYKNVQNNHHYKNPITIGKKQRTN